MKANIVLAIIGLALTGALFFVGFILSSLDDRIKCLDARLTQDIRDLREEIRVRDFDLRSTSAFKTDFPMGN